MKMITNINIELYKYWYKQMDDNCYTTFSQDAKNSMKAYEHIESKQILVNTAFIIELVMADDTPMTIIPERNDRDIYNIH